MNAQLTSQITVGLLVMWLATVLAMAMLFSLAVVGYVRSNRRQRNGARSREEARLSGFKPRFVPTAFDNPCRWLAIRSRNVDAVQAELRLHNPTRCSWDEGMAKVTDHKLFISPPIHGWILVVGQALPDPSDDVDICFHFIRRLSRELGEVQYFGTNRVVNHHAWVRADGERIIRAYAWAGETLWNQGSISTAETELGLRCVDYTETADSLLHGQGDSNSANAEKVPFLAARWSLDPTAIDEEMLSSAQGIAGDLIQSKPH